MFTSNVFISAIIYVLYKLNKKEYRYLLYLCLNSQVRKSDEYIEFNLHMYGLFYTHDLIENENLELAGEP